jgi:nucleoside-diphosphate-sugar epimerase
MKVLVTGGGGFLGQQLIASMLAAGALKVRDAAAREAIDRIICLDQAEGAIRDSRVENVAGDITDAALLARLLGSETRAVVHLAAVVSGTAEANFDLGMRVNVDGTRALLEAARSGGARPRLLFSSSLAVFGGELPAVVDDAVAPTPQGSYGVQKLIGEWLVHDYSRKGFIDGRCVRIPTVVVRPGRPNGAASGFASNIIREPLAGHAATLPVPPATRMWITSPRAAVANLRHALETDGSAWGTKRAVNLPGLSVSMSEALAALERVGGSAARARVTEQRDEAIERLVLTWPDQFRTDRALAMGFSADPDFDAIVRAHIDAYGSVDTRR